MRRIAIVGAGQAGLQLALGLVKSGYDVTVVSDRSAEEIRAGRIMSTQCMFDSALQTERDLDLNLWESAAPRIEGITYSVGSPEGERQICFSGRLDGYAQSVDQRLKFARWLEELQVLGGSVEIRRADLEYLEQLAREHELVVVAAGKGEIGALFERDPARSPFDSPQRWLAAAFVENLRPLDPPYFAISIVPGVGEYFVGPALTLSGPCNTMCFEALPGGEMDRSSVASLGDPEHFLAEQRRVLERFFPWEAERCGEIELTDEGGILAGAFAPTVRKPVGRLPSGAIVFGIGDAVVLNDPLVGQGANNAAKCATLVLGEILARGDAPFDEEWMRRTGVAYWDYAQWPTAFTNMMLSPPEHVGRLLDASSRLPAMADWLANGTNDPSTLFPWIGSADDLERCVADFSEREGMAAGA